MSPRGKSAGSPKRKTAGKTESELPESQENVGNLSGVSPPQNSDRTMEGARTARRSPRRAANDEEATFLGTSDTQEAEGHGFNGEDGSQDRVAGLPTHLTFARTPGAVGAKRPRTSMSPARTPRNQPEHSPSSSRQSKSPGRLLESLALSSSASSRHSPNAGHGRYSQHLGGSVARGYYSVRRSGSTSFTGLEPQLESVPIYENEIAQLKRDKELLNKQKIALEDELQSKKMVIHELENRVARKTEIIAERDLALDEASHKENKLNDLVDLCKDNISKLQTLKSDREAGLFEELEKFQRTILDLETSNIKYKKEIDKLKLDLKSMESLQAIKNQTDTHLINIQKEQSELKAQLTQRNFRISELESDLEEAKMKISKSGSSALSSMDKNSESNVLQRQIANYIDNKRKNDTKIFKLTQQNALLQSEKVNSNYLQEKILSMQRELDQQKKRLVSLLPAELELSQLRRKASTLQSLFEKNNLIKVVAGVKNEKSFAATSNIVKGNNQIAKTEEETGSKVSDTETFLDNLLDLGATGVIRRLADLHFENTLLKDQNSKEKETITVAENYTTQLKEYIEKYQMKLDEMESSKSSSSIESLQMKSKQVLLERELKSYKNQLQSYLDEENFEKEMNTQGTPGAESKDSTDMYSKPKTERIKELEQLLESKNEEIEKLIKEKTVIEVPKVNVKEEYVKPKDEESKYPKQDTSCMSPELISMIESLEKNLKVSQKEAERLQSHCDILSRELEMMDKSVGNVIKAVDHDKDTTKIVTLEKYPGFEYSRNKDEAVATLTKENEKLLASLMELGELFDKTNEQLAQSSNKSSSALIAAPTETSSNGLTVPMETYKSVNHRVQELTEQLTTSEKRYMRLKQVFSDQVKEFRELINKLLGYDLTFDPTGKNVLRSIYSSKERHDPSLEFRIEKGDDTQNASKQIKFRLINKSERHGVNNEAILDCYRNYVENARDPSIPAFLAQVTLSFIQQNQQNQ